MLCEQYGVRRNECVHRTRYFCPSESERVPIRGILIACSGDRTANDVLEIYKQPFTPPGDCYDLPNSVHYLVYKDGAIDELVPYNCYAYATCNRFDSYQFLTVLLEGKPPFNVYQIRAAARLACCLARNFDLLSRDPLEIQPIFDYDVNKTCLQQLPADFWIYFNACVNREDVVDAPPELACCNELRERLNDLTPRLAALEARVAALEARPDLTPRVEYLENALIVLSTQVANLNSQYESLRDLVYSIGARLTRIEECFNKLPQCKEQECCGRAEYVLRDCRQYVPLIANVVDFDRKIEDTDNIVTTGPLWCANIGDGFNNVKNYRVQGCLTISQRKWCIGKKVYVYLEDCVGNQLTVATWVSPSNGPQSPITLCWDTTIVVPAATVCCARIRIWTDDVTEQFVQICSGDIRISRV